LNGTAVAKDGKPYNNTCSWYMTLKNDRIVKAIGFFETLELADIWKRIPIRCDSGNLSFAMDIHLVQ
jgi:uncharacterized protein